MNAVRSLLSCSFNFTLSPSNLGPVSKRTAPWGTPAVRGPSWARARRRLSEEGGRGPKSWWTAQRTQTFSTVKTLKWVCCVAFSLQHLCAHLVNALNDAGSLGERRVSGVAAGPGSGWQRANFRSADSLPLDWWRKGSLPVWILQQLGEQNSSHSKVKGPNVCQQFYLFLNSSKCPMKLLSESYKCLNVAVVREWNKRRVVLVMLPPLASRLSKSEHLCGHRWSSWGRASVQVLRGWPVDPRPSRGQCLFT